jgi:4-hydroxybenzoate polyprenyltransferase
MQLRLQFHPRRALLFLSVLMAIGILSVLGGNATDIADRVFVFVWLALIVAGSMILSFRSWRLRRDPAAARRTLHAGQVGWLPRKWRRWVLDEHE